MGNWTLQLIESKIGRRQLGTLRGKSTTHAIVDLLHHWYSALDQKGYSITNRVVFDDYAKAFDHILPVIYKLIRFGIPCILVRWICSYLVHRQQSIELARHL